jgi:hypothetical protein
MCIPEKNLNHAKFGKPALDLAVGEIRALDADGEPMSRS